MQVQLLPVDVLGVPLQVKLDLLQHSSHVNRTGLKIDPSPISKAITQGRPRPSRLHLPGLELSPVPRDLRQALLAMVIGTRTILGDRQLPLLRRAGELAS